MRADKRRATFGRAYWRRRHPDVPPIVATIHLVARDWRNFTRLLTKAFAQVVQPVIEAFERLSDPLQAMVLAIADGDPDEPEWPDAQRVRPDDYDDTEWTLGRIDAALEAHHDG